MHEKENLSTYEHVPNLQLEERINHRPTNYMGCALGKFQSANI